MMGYSTRYSLKVVDGDNVMDRAVIAVESTSQYSFDEIKDSGEWVTDMIWWYAHEQDMVHVSKLFPDTVFELSGEGEEPGDLWKKYFKNGKVQRSYAKIVYDPYDENKLEDPSEEVF